MLDSPFRSSWSISSSLQKYHYIIIAITLKKLFIYLRQVLHLSLFFLLFTRILLHVLFLMNFRIYLLSSMRNCTGFFIEMTSSLYIIYRKLIHLQYEISPSWSIRCLFIQKSFCVLVHFFRFIPWLFVLVRFGHFYEWDFFMAFYDWLLVVYGKIY